MLENLVKKIIEKKANICILGLGRVGLPLSSVLANSGFNVTGIDVNQELIDSVKKGICPFFDPALQENLEKSIKSGNFSVVRNISEAKSPDVIFFTVGTPSSGEGTVDYTQLYGALEEISKLDLVNKMIILRSTMPPKTTEDVIIPYLEDKLSLKCGIDFGLAVCPERILEGKAIKEIFDLPEIVGGVNEISNKIAKEVFLGINNKKDILFTTPTGAELTKLFTNIYRYNMFALSNEFAIWAEHYGVDGNEIIKIANHNYERCNIPVPGFAGGPCLSKDSTFLENNIAFASIVSAAWKLNESIPQHIVGNLKKLVGNLYGKKIAVLGISFKANSDDVRDSPAVKLVGILKSTGANLKIHDPFVKNTDDIEVSLESADVVIIATNHNNFKNYIDIINKSNPSLIYDVWGMFQKSDFRNSKYIKFGESFN